MDVLLILICTVIWLNIGMYSYIHWMQKNNNYRHRKWKKDDVALIPLMGFLGVFSYIIGYIIFTNNLNNLKNL